MATGELRLAMDPNEIDIELRNVDREIIEMLKDGRCTRRHLANTLGYTGEYVYQRVTRLMEHGIVEKIHDGFYELATDGGEAVAPEPRAEFTSHGQDDHVALGDDLPQSIERADARRVVAAVLDVIDADGPLERKQIVAELDDEYSLGYDMENRDGAWWKRIVAPSIKANGAEHKPGRGWTRV